MSYLIIYFSTNVKPNELKTAKRFLLIRKDNLDIKIIHTKDNPWQLWTRGSSYHAFPKVESDPVIFFGEIIF